MDGEMPSPILGQELRETAARVHEQWLYRHIPQFAADVLHLATQGHTGAIVTIPFMYERVVREYLGKHNIRSSEHIDSSGGSVQRLSGYEWLDLRDGGTGGEGDDTGSDSGSDSADGSGDEDIDYLSSDEDDVVATPERRPCITACASLEYRTYPATPGRPKIGPGPLSSGCKGGTKEGGGGTLGTKPAPQIDFGDPHSTTMLISWD
jgi:hypothetical protein